MVQLLAQAKAEALVGAEPGGEVVDGIVLGGDSAFLIGGRIHGKPHRPEVARQRWLEQNGGSGELWSGHWLIDHRGGRVRGAVGRADVATVRFADLDEAEIDAYIASGEPLLVAGAFTIDSLGGPFIDRVEGDPSTVVGMSLSTLRELVRELGVDVAGAVEPPTLEPLRRSGHRRRPHRVELLSCGRRPKADHGPPSRLEHHASHRQGPHRQPRRDRRSRHPRRP